MQQKLTARGSDLRSISFLGWTVNPLYSPTTSPALQSYNRQTAIASFDLQKVLYSSYFLSRRSCSDHTFRLLLDKSQRSGDHSSWLLQLKNWRPCALISVTLHKKFPIFSSCLEIFPL